MPLVVLALPHNGSMTPESIAGIALSTLRDDVEIINAQERSSFLTLVFNSLWCKALNHAPRPTHFAMMHSDIHVEPGWLDVLLEEMEKSGADVIAACAAIKDGSGDTSTAVMDDAGRVRRVSLAELLTLPVTFGSDELHGKLLNNTGLWVAKFGDWADKFPGFDVNNRIVNEDGVYRAVSMPEDWKFSLWCHEAGLRIRATSAVRANHFGERPWPCGGKRG
jgi:hypothetical protein